MTRRPLVVGLLLLLGCARGKVPAVIVAAGHVEATEVRVASKLAGRLQQVGVREGDVVVKGQELARLEATDLGLLRRQVQAEQAGAAAELRLRLKGARAEDIAELQAQLRAVQADLAGAARDLERLQALLDKGSGTTKARDDARTRRDALQARLEALQQALQRLQAGFRDEEKDVARAHLASAEARLAQLDQQLADTHIASPLDGVVTEKLVESGELLAAGTPIAVVTDLRDAWLTVYVPETELGRVRVGQTVDVVTDDNQTRTGRLTYVSSRAEFTPKNVQTKDERVKLVYELRVALPNDDGMFKPGMPAEARLAPAAAETPR